MPYKDPQARRARQAIYRAAHRDKILAYLVTYGQKWRADHPDYHKDRYAANRDKRIAQVAARTAANPEMHKATASRWYLDHRDLTMSRARTSTLKRHGAPTCDHASCLVIGPNVLAWQTNEHVCYLCGVPVRAGDNRHMDHVIPIARGGLHCAENLRPACAACNMRKHTKTPEEFLAAG